MKKPLILCPYTRTETGTGLILCGLSKGKYCGHSVYRRCRGWCENTPDAVACQVRKEAESGTQKQNLGTAGTAGNP